MSATGMTVVLAALIGGGAGTLGALLLMNQRYKQLKQRFQQVRQEIDGLLLTRSTRVTPNPEISKTLERLNQTMQDSFAQVAQEQKQAQKQLQGEVGGLRKEFNQLREASTLLASLQIPKLRPSSNALIRFQSVRLNPKDSQVRAFYPRRQLACRPSPVLRRQPTTCQSQIQG